MALPQSQKNAPDAATTVLGGGPSMSSIKPRPLILVDLDGTLFDMEHRVHFLAEKNYDAFFEAVKDDTPIWWCAELVAAMASRGFRIAFVSGRNEVARAETKRQLEKLGFGEFPLYMRPRYDYREDYLIKADIFDRWFLNENILFVIDDRSQVVKMWRERGLTVLQCAEGNF